MQNYVFFQASTTLFDKKDDFSELPPNQRRKKLQAKIEEITGKVMTMRENESIGSCKGVHLFIDLCF